MLDNFDTIINESNSPLISNESTKFSYNEFQKLNQLNKNIIHQTIDNRRNMIDNFQRTIEAQKQRNYFRNPKDQSIINAIEDRRIHMIARANYMKQYKIALSFAGKETP